MRMPEPKPAWTWDFYGACAPNEDDAVAHARQETFTLGCFQWEPKSRGPGVKKGKVRYRVKGKMDDPKKAFDAARDYCARKNLMEAK